MFSHLKLVLVSAFSAFRENNLLVALAGLAASQAASLAAASHIQPGSLPATATSSQAACQPASQLSHIQLAATQNHEKAVFLQSRLFLFPLFPLFGKIFLWSHANTLLRAKKPPVKQNVLYPLRGGGEGELRGGVAGRDGRRSEGWKRKGEREGGGVMEIFFNIFHTSCYTFIYLYILPNTSKYLYIPSYTFMQPHILQNLQYQENEDQLKIQKWS